MSNFLSNKYFGSYLSELNVDIEALFTELKETEWTPDNFRFYTAVSVMSSSKIEGEQLEVDSYVKHKVLDIAYLPDLVEKPNDLYKAYEFARDNKLSSTNFLEAHNIATRHLLPPAQRGTVRTGNMLIMEQQTNKIKYEAASAAIVKNQYQLFWDELENILKAPLQPHEAFYYASLIHLLFVKIHPFNDGNGRTARLLEKWFLAEILGEKAWYLGSEYYYYTHLQEYYNNLAIVGLFYESLDHNKSLPFLLMLPNSLIIKK